MLKRRRHSTRDRYLDDVTQRRVFPSPAALRDLQGFSVELQDEPIDPAKVLAELDTLGSPATVASTGGRYFGFVTGGALPATLAANMLAGAWDQNAGLELGSPVNAHLEKVCRGWLVSLLGLPAQTEVGFVTGATMANFTGLAAARHAVLRAQGWDVEAQGLFGAPPITVVVGDEVHVSLLKALGMLGLGRERVVRVPADAQGRMIAAQLPADRRPDDRVHAGGQREHRRVRSARRDRCAPARDRRVDSRRRRVRPVGGGVRLRSARWPTASTSRTRWRPTRTSGSTCRTTAAWCSCATGARSIRRCRRAPRISSQGETRDPHLFVPEMSRRARAVEVWAALRSLGPARARRADRAQLPARRALRERAAQGRLPGPERRRAEPGAGFVRRAGRHAARDRRDPAGRHVLVRRHVVAGKHRDAHQRFVVGDDRRGRRAEHRSHPALCARSAIRNGAV